jgi:hypothetical protein
MTLIAVYSSLDGTALRQCNEFNSDYSWVMFYSTIAGALGPLLATATIKDAAEGSSGKATQVIKVGYYFFATSSSLLQRRTTTAICSGFTMAAYYWLC